MTRLNLVLLLVLVVSAMGLVRSSYDARRLFAAIHKADAQTQRLVGENQRLQAERQAQATIQRVERVARERLAMRTPSPAVTTYVVDPQGTATLPAAALSTPAQAVARPHATTPAASGAPR